MTDKELHEQAVAEGERIIDIAEQRSKVTIRPKKDLRKLQLRKGDILLVQADLTHDQAADLRQDLQRFLDSQEIRASALVLPYDFDVTQLSVSDMTADFIMSVAPLVAERIKVGLA